MASQDIDSHPTLSEEFHFEFVESQAKFLDCIIWWESFVLLLSSSIFLVQHVSFMPVHSIMAQLHKL